MTLKNKPACRGALAAALTGITAGILAAMHELNTSPWSLGVLVFTAAILTASATLGRPR
jgi:hypothetical protein